MLTVPGIFFEVVLSPFCAQIVLVKAKNKIRVKLRMGFMEIEVSRFKFVDKYTQIQSEIKLSLYKFSMKQKKPAKISPVLIL